MTAWYNENDPFAAAWLRELIKDGLIAPGVVDERSIVDVRPDDLQGYSQCHFFAGIGGWSHALRLALWPDDRPVWTGSCPCHPFSAAGKRKGFDDERHLWPVWRDLIAQRAPAIVFGEQVAGAADWLGLVRGDLEAMAYAVGAAPVEAASAGADHLRDRFWFVAHGQRGPGDRRADEPQRRAQGRAAADGFGSKFDLALAECGGCEGRQPERHRQSGPTLPSGEASCVGDASGTRGWRNSGTVPCAKGEGAGERCGARHLADESQPAGFDWAIGADGKARRVKSGIRLLAHGFPARVGLLRGFGNAIDPRPAAAFIRAADEAMRAA